MRLKVFGNQPRSNIKICNILLQKCRKMSNAWELLFRHKKRAVLTALEK
jgi:hypothetical protein